MSTPITPNEETVRFQCFLTKAQHAYIKRLSYESGISGGYAIRKGLSMFAKRRGVNLSPGAVPFGRR